MLKALIKKTKVYIHVVGDQSYSPEDLQFGMMDGDLLIKVTPEKSKEKKKDD